MERKRLVSPEPLSVHRDLYVLLYVGILLITGALGSLIYKNADSVGHGVLAGLMSCATIAGFFWGFKHSKEFSRRKVEQERAGLHHILLLGSLLLLSVIGYLHYQP